jgi:hypothetical protein
MFTYVVKYCAGIHKYFGCFMDLRELKTGRFMIWRTGQRSGASKSCCMTSQPFTGRG